MKRSQPAAKRVKSQALRFKNRMQMDIQEIAGQIDQRGYIVLEKLLADTMLDRLYARCQHDDPSRFNAAQIGRGSAKQRISSVRGDAISWLTDMHPADAAYLSFMEELRLGLNERLFLGLFDYECHYAIYEKGMGYAKHTDVLSGKKNRVLSTVLYLNEGWKESDGGELVLYDSQDAILETVAPRYGTMIIFLSEHFPHEVLISQNTRRSIAGWFRISGS